MIDSTWLRRMSLYLPVWVRLTFFASAVVGQGLKQLATLFHPRIDYAAISDPGWMIFGMFVTFPAVFVWRSFIRNLFPKLEKAAEREADFETLRKALKEARMNKTEQSRKWRGLVDSIAYRLELHYSVQVWELPSRTTLPPVGDGRSDGIADTLTKS
jgi:hypothetical protein